VHFLIFYRISKDEAALLSTMAMQVYIVLELACLMLFEDSLFGADDSRVLFHGGLLIKSI